MQTLVELLLELKTLAGAPDPHRQLERINALLADPLLPAEFQVGRHYVARALRSTIEQQVHDLDPRARLAAIEAIRTVFPRSTAGRVLRRVLRDPDRKVRQAVRLAVHALGLHHAPPPEVRHAATAGGAGAGSSRSDVSWAFGVFASDRAEPRRTRQPARQTALEAHALPKLGSPADVAKLVGLAEDDLAALMRPGTEAGSGYVEFEIPKAKGGTRRISAPRAPLRRVQRLLLEQILDRIPVHDACHGFVAGRSTVTNARPHERAAVVLKLDLKDFFPTVHYRRVKGLFEQLGYSAEVAGTLAGLTTHRPKLPDGEVVWPGALPQGAPTSPALANLACRRLDHRLARLAARCGAVYTRYADDLTFSFAEPPALRIGRFLWWVDGICLEEGFAERPDKRRVLRKKHQQRVTGLVVNDHTAVPRADRRRFRAILHNCQKHGVASQARDREEFEAYLAGYAAYIHMVDPPLGKQYMAEVARLLGEHRA